MKNVSFVQYSHCIVSLLLAIFILGTPLYAQQKKQTLAVMEFEGYGVDQFAVKTLTDRFRSQAVSDGTFRIMERGAMDEILSEQKFQLSGCTSDECIIEIGKFLGVQFMLGATVGRVGDTYALSMRMISVESGEIIKTANFDMTGKIDRLLTEGIQEAAGLIFGKIEKLAAGIVIGSNPSGTKISIDGEERGRTPINLNDLMAETQYQISIQGLNYRTFDTTLTLQEGRNSRLDIELERETGKLTIEGNPSNSLIFIGNEKIGTIPLREYSYPTGSYELKVQQAGFNSFQQGIKIETDRLLPIQVELLPKSKGKALAFSLVLPGSGQIYMGNKGRGYLMLLSSLVSGYMSYQNYNTFIDNRTIYEDKNEVYNANLTQPDLLAGQKQDMLDAFDTMKENEKSLLAMTGLLGGVWTLNILEIMF